ncbi:MAG: hypothetical protein U0228_32665 [Myxococcaceae bacterium]
MGPGVAVLLTAVSTTLLAVAPVTGGPLSPPVIVINNQAGNQNDPHVDADLAAYSADSSSGTVIHRYAFSTNTDSTVPTLSGAIDLLSDVDQGRVVFTRVFPDGHTGIMLFDGTTVVELAPAPASTRIGVGIGGNTVAFIDYTVNPAGPELVVLDLATSTLHQITNDSATDMNPAVSPDGAVVTWEHCSSTDCDVWVASNSGSGWVAGPLAASTTLSETNPDSNGSTVVFQQEDTGTGVTHIAFAPTSGGSPTVLELAGSQAHPSIRGKLIAFENNDGAHSDIYLYEISSNRLFQVTNTPTIDEHLNDVTVLSGGEVRIVWEAFDEPGAPANGNIYGATFVLPSSGGGGGGGTCSGAVTLEAKREYAPTRWTDANANLSFPVVIPATLPVTTGNAGNKQASLTFTTSSGTVVCRYVGGSHKAHPTSPVDVAAGLAYVFDRCQLLGSSNGDDDDDHHCHGRSRGHGHGHDGDGEDDDDGHPQTTYAAGDTIVASKVTLHVHDGDHFRGTTTVRVTLAESCSTSTHPLNAAGAPDATPQAGCSASGLGVVPFVLVMAVLLFFRRRPAEIRLVARRERRKLPR